MATKSCSICLNEIQDDTCVYLPCTHHFHKQCINPWLIDHDRCPECRTNIHEANHQELLIVNESTESNAESSSNNEIYFHMSDADLLHNLHESSSTMMDEYKEYMINNKEQVIKYFNPNLENSFRSYDKLIKVIEILKNNKLYKYDGNIIELFLQKNEIQHQMLKVESEIIFNQHKDQIYRQYETNPIHTRNWYSTNNLRDIHLFTINEMYPDILNNCLSSFIVKKLKSKYNISRHFHPYVECRKSQNINQAKYILKEYSR